MLVCTGWLKYFIIQFQETTSRMRDIGLHNGYIIFFLPCGMPFEISMYMLYVTTSFHLAVENHLILKLILHQYH